MSGGILAGGFADRRRVPFEVEKIIGDLKGCAERNAVMADGARVQTIALAENGSRNAAEMQKRTGFHRLQRFNLPLAKFGLLTVEAPFCRKVEHLPSDHAAKPGRSRKSAHQCRANFGVDVGFRARENVES